MEPDTKETVVLANVFAQGALDLRKHDEVVPVVGHVWINAVRAMVPKPDGTERQAVVVFKPGGIERFEVEVLDRGEYVRRDCNPYALAEELLGLEMDKESPTAFDGSHLSMAYDVRYLGKARGAFEALTLSEREKPYLSALPAGTRAEDFPHSRYRQREKSAATAKAPRGVPRAPWDKPTPKKSPVRILATERTPPMVADAAESEPREPPQRAGNRWRWEVGSGAWLAAGTVLATVAISIVVVWLGVGWLQKEIERGIDEARQARNEAASHAEDVRGMMEEMERAVVAARQTENTAEEHADSARRALLESENSSGKPIEPARDRGRLEGQQLSNQGGVAGHGSERDSLLEEQDSPANTKTTAAEARRTMAEDAERQY